ncbi:MAG: hypothetical protein LBM01_00795 [Christensenellaceae bacterium]|jgi:hypothetical protein|nr:hypothetical protein [Christensenellaceae bacterium]
MKNLELFKLIETSPEVGIDANYKHDKVILEGELVRQNQKLIDLITTAETILSNKSYSADALETTLSEIKKVLGVSGMNFSCFAQFLHTLNLTFRDVIEADDAGFLIHILKEYIKNRHQLYKHYGYSPIVLQVGYDSYSNRRLGVAGLNKIKAQLLENGVDYIIFPDKADKDEFNKLLRDNKIKFKFRDDHNNKYPDVCFKIGDEIFICEHKHITGRGGSQDKQILETIDFIKYGEKKVHYVSYMDGLAVNDFVLGATAKTKTQYENIVKHLKEFPNNYFVNTGGFDELLKYFKSRI